MAYIIQNLVHTVSKIYQMLNGKNRVSMHRVSMQYICTSPLKWLIQTLIECIQVSSNVCIMAIFIGNIVYFVAFVLNYHGLHVYYWHTLWLFDIVIALKTYLICKLNFTKWTTTIKKMNWWVCVLLHKYHK
jgi:hypothetical protein